MVSFITEKGFWHIEEQKKIKWFFSIDIMTEIELRTFGKWEIFEETKEMN